MLYLLQVEFKKLRHYRTFWVICGLYFLTLGMTTATGMEFLKWLVNLFDKFDAEVNINRIPLYHFPDVWQNLTFISGFFKIVLAMMVVISITNEYTYRTLRQNIIDGMSRWEFLLSKILMNVLLSAMSCGMVFVIAFVTGLIYSPEINWSFAFTGIDFFIGYFLEVFTYLSYALMLGIMIQRSGLTIVLLLLSNMLEAIVKANVDDFVPALIPYFPLESISNLVPMPFPKYVLQEIQDYVSLTAVLVAAAWAFLFNFFSYRKLLKSDL